MLQPPCCTARVLACSMLTLPAAAQLQQAADPGESVWAFRSNDTGRLIYGFDDLGRRLADFSNVGYRGGNEALPDASGFAASRVVAVASSGAGDDTARLQAAIDQAGAMTVQADGYRGVVQLGAGDFRVSSRLNLNDSGVVLRGAGDQQTTIRSVGTGFGDSVIRVGGGAAVASGAGQAVLDKYVPHGSASLRVDNAAGFRVGNTVRVRRDYNTQDGVSDRWVRDLGMDRLDDPGVADQPGVDRPWGDDQEVRDSTRRVVHIDGNRLFFDAPLTTEIDAKYGGGSVSRLDTSANARNVGIENLRYVGDFDAGVSRRDRRQLDYAATFIKVDNAEDVFVRGVDTKNLSYANTQVQNGARHVTVEGNSHDDFIGPIEGGQRYTYTLNGELSLVDDSTSRGGRHDFVTNSRSVGPNVFLRSSATKSYNASGPHQRWNVGALFDNVTLDPNFSGGVQEGLLEARNRGPSGSGHGYGGAYQVAWNTESNRVAFQTPVNQNDPDGQPLARNWVIGAVTQNGIFNPGDFLNAPIGDVDSPERRVSLGDTASNPDNSLYVAQLEQRLTNPAAQTREYWLGDFDRFENLAGDEDTPPVAADWLATVAAFVASNPNTDGIKGFDDDTDDQAIAMTFDFDVADGETVVAAVLSVGLRRTGIGATNNDSMFIERLADEVRFNEDLGLTRNLSNASTTALQFEFVTGGVGFDLVDLQDGRLNLLFADDIDIDWADLTLSVAPTASIPEPASMALLAGAGLVLLRRR